MGDETMSDKTERLIESMNRLNVELASFRSEMREFKNTMNRRIDFVESSQRECQIHPMTCATARRLEEFIKASDGKGKSVIAWGSFAISCVSLVIVLLKSVVLRG